MHSTHVYYILYILYTPQMCHKIMQVGNRKESTLYLARGREQHEITNIYRHFMFQVSQVGEVLRALGTNPTEGEVKKLIQSTVTVSVP